VTPTRAAEGDLRRYAHPSGLWLAVKVEQSFGDRATYSVSVGTGYAGSGSYSDLGVPLARYEEALAVALSLYAQLVDPFMDECDRKVRAERQHERAAILGLDTLG
jgi:hypothetical protein